MSYAATMRRAIAGVLAMTSLGVAHASPWKVMGEAAIEVDSNVQRVVDNAMAPPTAAPVTRLGAELRRQAPVARGRYVFGASALSRVVTSSDPALQLENVVLLRGDAGWYHPVGERPVELGLAISAHDAVPISDEVGALTFRTLTADGRMVVYGEGHVVTLAVGAQSYDYKPDSRPMSPELDNDHDWFGPTARATYYLPLWEAVDRRQSLSLTTMLGVELRRHETVAYAESGTNDPSPMNNLAPTSLPRRDRFQLASALVSWDSTAASIDLYYQLQVTSSNSFGASFVRHQATLSGTVPWGGFYVTPRATLQLDHYPDGLPIFDPETGQPTSLDDDNQSSLQIVIGRHVSDAWSLEARAAIWRDLASASNATFRRELVSFGVRYTD